MKKRIRERDLTRANGAARANMLREEDRALDRRLAATRAAVRWHAEVLERLERAIESVGDSRQDARAKVRSDPVLVNGRRLRSESERLVAKEELKLIRREQEALLAEHKRAVKELRFSRTRVRLRAWVTPRLGTLRQHEPRALRVPAHYFDTRPPQPAPRITLVTPSFNQGAFVWRTVGSVLDQGYPDLEYVVQDGGSTDATLEHLERHRQALARFESGPDGGQANAINRGFAGTSGEIMAYLNSDDLLLPGSLAYVAGYFAENPDVDVVYGHRLMIDERGREVGAWVMPPHDDEQLSWSDWIPQETLFWRRSAWEAAGGRIDESFSFALDWDLLLRLRDAGARMRRLPRFLGAFRVHAEQKTATQVERCWEESALLRARSLGRPVDDGEVERRVRPFLRRHLIHHTANRLWNRRPLASWRELP
jgi:GT2 family glycosyltransferase